MADSKSIVKKVDVGQQVIDRISKLSEVGMTFPKDYNYINAIKASMLVLQETVDKNKKPALEVCTPASIQKSLFTMATMGLDVSRNQGFFICRGDKLTFQPSYFGHILQVKRLFPNWSPIAHTVREGDDFVYTIDPATGKMKLVKHEQKLENIDNDFVGAYMYLPCADNEPELYVMTRKQILKAWSKSSSQSLQVHKDFDEKMAIRTLINSGCKKVISATPDYSMVVDDEDDPNHNNNEADDTQFTDFVEVHDDEPKEEQKQIEQPSQEEPEKEKVMVRAGGGNEPQENNDEF